SGRTRFTGGQGRLSGLHRTRGRGGIEIKSPLSRAGTEERVPILFTPRKLHGFRGVSFPGPEYP
ncbi:hypothetical protein, partial [Burkholderia gladioli]|uniref:hypothetical protein n=1 Tax=Burkholderia gladioli TaxID=28095 RepID=UPI003F7AD9DB